MGTIAKALQGVKSRIAEAALANGRDPREILLVAVSKAQSVRAIREAYAAGQRDFGENYVQEAAAKMDALKDLADIAWHFIGPIQSNKTRSIAERFEWVHSIDRLKIAERLSQHRGSELALQQACLQVNTSGEATKSGCVPEEAVALARAIRSLNGLRLRGLMTVPEPTEDRAVQRLRFMALRKLAEDMRVAGIELDTLSMGMSQDFEEAIAAGSTIVRVGTAIFGERKT